MEANITIQKCCKDRQGYSTPGVLLSKRGGDRKKRWRMSTNCLEGKERWVELERMAIPKRFSMIKNEATTYGVENSDGQVMCVLVNMQHDPRSRSYRRKLSDISRSTPFHTCARRMSGSRPLNGTRTTTYYDRNHQTVYENVNQ